MASSLDAVWWNGSDYRNTFSKNATDPSKAGPIDIPMLRVLACALPLPLVAAVSAHLRLGLHRKLAIGVVRCATQLSLLGYVLVPIFNANKWWITLLYTLFMLSMAAIEAVSRPALAYRGMLFHVLLAVGVACAAVITLGMAFIVQIKPIYDAPYLIPMLGMLLGNSLSTVAVGLSAVLEELSTGKDNIEALLALGATRFEANRDVVRKAARLAFTPLLNSLNIVGVATVPGMMTGQILGGSDPAVASRYQIVIFYMVATASSMASVSVIYAAVLTVCDGCSRLRLDRLHAQGSTRRGALAWLAAQFKEAWARGAGGFRSLGRTLRRRLRGTPRPRARHRYFEYRNVERGVIGRESLRAEEGALPAASEGPRGPAASEARGLEVPLLSERGLS